MQSHEPQPQSKHLVWPGFGTTGFTIVWMLEVGDMTGLVRSRILKDMYRLRKEVEPL